MLFMNDTYLVTGGAGFIGSHFVEEILTGSFASKVVIVDNLSMGVRSNIPSDSRIQFIEGDVSDPSLIKRLFSENHFDYVAHFAAIANVQDSIDNPVLTHKVNFDATLTLLEAARMQGSLKRFVFASSAAVYGDNPNLPCRETDAVNPISPYGIDKYSSERYVVNFAKLYGIPTTAFRFFNIYGPRQNPDSPYSGVISIFADRFKNIQPDLKIFGDGNQTRDFVYVKDLIRIIISSFTNDRAVGDVFNICTSKSTSLNALIHAFEIITNKKATVSYYEPRDGDIRDSVGSNEKIVSNGFISSFTSLEMGLSELIKSL